MSIYEKLAKVQQTLVAKKDKWNDYSKYKYRSAEGILESLKPLLKEHGLMILSDNDTVFIGGWHYSKVTLTLYDIETPTNQLTTNGLARESESLKGQISAQITGGSQSYALKCALNSMFAIDDGNGDADSQNTSDDMETPKPCNQPSGAIIAPTANKTYSWFLKQYTMW